MYEVYGWGYLCDGVYGECYICECKTVKQAVRTLEENVDGEVFTGGFVYKVGTQDDTMELVYNLVPWEELV